MAVTVTIASEMSKTEDYIEKEQHVTKLRRLIAEEIDMSVDHVNYCVSMEGYLLPEDMEGSDILESLKEDFEAKKTYILITFLIETEENTEQDFESIVGDILLGLEQGDLTTSEQPILAIYAHEFLN